jgi:uncharacterized protein DUF4186
VYGPEGVRKHAAEFIAKRLAPAFPYKDGKQTPYRGRIERELES